VANAHSTECDISRLKHEQKHSEKNEYNTENVKNVFTFVTGIY